jgi:hypothetical protein
VWCNSCGNRLRTKSRYSQSPTIVARRK